MSVVTTALLLVTIDASFVTTIGLFVTKDVYLAVTAGLCLSKAIALAGRVVSFVTSLTMLVYVAGDTGFESDQIEYQITKTFLCSQCKPVQWVGIVRP
jgi:hypothetical protein